MTTQRTDADGIRRNTVRASPSNSVEDRKVSGSAGETRSTFGEACFFVAMLLYVLLDVVQIRSPNSLQQRHAPSSCWPLALRLLPAPAVVAGACGAALVPPAPAGWPGSATPLWLCRG